jgi:hypothetical protein
MDWPSVVHPYLTDQDLEDFVYDSPSQIKCRVVTHQVGSHLDSYLYLAREAEGTITGHPSRTPQKLIQVSRD